MSPQQTVDASQNVEKRKNVNKNRRCNRQAEKSSVETTLSCFLGFAPAVARAHVGCLGCSVFSGPGSLGPRRFVAVLTPLVFLFFSFSFSFCLRLRFFLVHAALGALCLGTALLSFFFHLRVRPCVWCCACPSSPGGYSPCFAVARVLLSATVGWRVLFCVVCGVLRCF